MKSVYESEILKELDFAREVAQYGKDSNSLDLYIKGYLRVGDIAS